MAKYCASYWYTPVQYYNFSMPGPGQYTSDFTQLVWNDSTQIGFGLGYTVFGKVRYFFCATHMSPAGNINGSYDQNVFSNIPITTTTTKFNPISILPNATELESFRRAALNRINSYRALHQAPPLTRLAAIDASAQAQAESLATKGVCMYTLNLNTTGQSYYQKLCRLVLFLLL